MHRIAVIDDNFMLLENIVYRLQSDFEVCFYAQEAEELFNYLSSSTPARHPELVLMDIEMVGMDGIAATAKLKSNYPNIKIAMLTVFEQEEKVMQSILAGADGYILKDETKEKTVSGILDILSGGAFMSASIARKAMQMLKVNSPTKEIDLTVVSVLSKRELEILQLIANGMPYKEISAQLFISTATTKTHVHNIFEKLQVKNKMEAAARLKSFPRVSSSGK